MLTRLQKMRATTGQVLNPADFTFLSGGATTVCSRCRW